MFDNHNAEYVLQQRAWETDRLKPTRWHSAAYSLVQWDKLRRYERQICQRADRVCGLQGRPRCAAACDPHDITVIPNGVNRTTTRPINGPMTHGA